MNKKIKYAKNGAALGALGFALGNGISQLFPREENKKFDWKDFFLAIAKGAGIGGTAGLLIGGVADYLNKVEVPINTDASLLSMINDVRLDPENYQYKYLKQKSDWLIDLLCHEFRDDLKKSPYRFGSTEKGTALARDYDIDIFVPFKSGSFASIADMFFTLFETLKKLEGTNGVRTVREQNKSIGILFLINGKIVKIDVVPQKGTRNSRTSGYLYVNNTGLFEKPSRKKTDIQLQNSLRLSETQKKIIIILKEWKSLESLPLSSHLLQYLVIEAYSFNRGNIPRHFTNKIVMVLEFIQNNIETLVLTSVENTNNVLTNISTEDKSKISKACKEVIEEYEYQPNTIINLIN